MKGLDWARVPLLIVVAVLLLGGGLLYVREGEGSGAAALLAGGMVILGAWLSLEAIAVHRRMHRDDGDGGE